MELIRTVAVTDDNQWMENIPLDQLEDRKIRWFWVDFHAPGEEETRLLSSRFHFHPLAIEDCLHGLQRPKLDHYGQVHFLVLHAINPDTLASEEVNLFLGTNFIVSFHLKMSREVDEVWDRIRKQPPLPELGPVSIAYFIMDNLVDNYFPCVYQLEDQLNEIETVDIRNKSVQEWLDKVFEIRSQLLKLRRTVVPMKELLYRIINTDKMAGVKEQLAYFMDIHDHLLKLSEILETNRDLTEDIRDGYMSIYSNRMNGIMKTLTVMTSVFVPLTFIASIYGMNFRYIPELSWRWGYFAVLGLMLTIGAGLLIWFWRKGWFK